MHTWVLALIVLNYSLTQMIWHWCHSGFAAEIETICEEELGSGNLRHTEMLFAASFSVISDELYKDPSWYRPYFCIRGAKLQSASILTSELAVRTHDRSLESEFTNFSLFRGHNLNIKPPWAYFWTRKELIIHASLVCLLRRSSSKMCR